MSHWTGSEVVHWPPFLDPDHPGWACVDCGCCAGIEWSAGTVARECSDCWGTGRFWVHLRTGTRAIYPGGELLGWRYTADMLIHLQGRLTEPGVVRC